MRIHQINLDDDLFIFVAACIGLGVSGVTDDDEMAARWLHWLEHKFKSLTPAEQLYYLNTLRSQFPPERLEK